ncbi:MAG: DinB family protein [Hyphomicrobiales bacterium]
MITKIFLETMASYNAWQNREIYAAADTLSDDARKLDRGAFFKSIHGTLTHLYWGDKIWMSRFSDETPPHLDLKSSLEEIHDWQDLKTARVSLDDTILKWAGDVDESWIAGDMSWYSSSAEREITKPKWVLLTHFFNHQTHHRGQAHAMITAVGAKTADTDLPFMPEA